MFEDFFYSIGTVLGAAGLLVPFGLVGWLWNKATPRRRVNPWRLPFWAGTFLTLLCAFGPGEGPFEDRWVVVSGLLCVSLLSLSRARRFQRSASAASDANRL